MEGEGSPGRAVPADQGTEERTQGHPGSPGWLEYGAGGTCLADGLGRDVQPPASCSETELNPEGRREPQARAPRTPGVLSVGAAYILGRMLLWCGAALCVLGHLPHPGLCPPDASGTTLPCNRDSPKRLQTLADVPCWAGAKHRPLISGTESGGDDMTASCFCELAPTTMENRLEGRTG